VTKKDTVPVTTFDICFFVYLVYNSV